MKTAIILAGGRGRKMWPYGVTQNKAVLPVANRPLISWTIEALKKAGIENISIITDYRREQLQFALSNETGIHFIEQKSVNGTAAALVSAWDVFQDEEVLVCYGDVLVSPEDIQQLVVRHKTTECPLSALVQPLGDEHPGDWICARVEKEQLVQVLGHPRDEVTHRFCGVYALNRHFNDYLKNNPGRMRAVQVAMMPPDEAFFEDSLQMAIEAKLDIAAIEVDGPFVDLDKPWHILEANEKWLRYLSDRSSKNKIGKKSKISERATINGHVVLGENSYIGDNVIIEGDIWVGNNTKITQGAIIEGMVSIGDRCLIRRYCQVEAGSAIGDQCVVNHCAEVSGVLMRNSYAYHYGEFWGVLGEAGDLGAATVCGNLRFDDGRTRHKIGGRREVPVHGANAAYLGDYVRTGVNAIIMPGVKVGPYSVIGAGTLVQRDVPERTSIFVKQEYVQNKWGPERYGW